MQQPYIIIHKRNCMEQERTKKSMQSNAGNSVCELNTKRKTQPVARQSYIKKKKL